VARLVPAFVLAAIGAALPAARGGAQAPHLLKGRVVSEATHQPLADAEVVLMDFGRLVRTGATGAFSIMVPSVPYRLQVRRIGYLSRAFRFKGRADTLEVEFTLVPTAMVLESLTVTGKSGSVSPRLAEFERRRQVSAVGQFLGNAELVPYRDQRLGNVLRKLRGIRVVPLGGFGLTALSMRGNAGQSDCYMAVWVDGIQMSTPGRPFDLESLLVERIGGVEVYSGPSEVPVEFDPPGGTGCGAIIIWTRDR